MKFFIVALAIAAVAAEPEADSDSFLLNPYNALGYRNIYGYNTAAYTPLGYSRPVYGGVYSPYSTYGARIIGKREADSDSDSYLLNPYNALGYRSIYGYNTAFNPAVTGYTGLTGYTGYSGVYSPYSTYGARIIGKREAESDSDSYLLNPYNSLGYRSIYGYNTAFTAPVTGYTGLTGYTGYSGVYSPYTTYGARVIGKREAEADPELVYKNPVTGFHTNLRNVQKVASAQAQAPVVPQVYNNLAVNPLNVGYTGYTAGYATPAVYSGVYSPYSLGYRSAIFG